MAYPQQLMNQNQYQPNQFQNQYQNNQFPSYTPQPQGSWLERFFGGTQDTFSQIPKFSPQQYDILSQLLGSSFNQYQNPYEGFQGIEDYTKQQFFQDLIPQLSEQFTSMGGRGSASLSSPAFASQLGQAGSGLAGLLGQQRAQYGMQNRGQAMQGLQLGLQDPYHTVRQEGQPGFFQNLMGNVNQASQAALKALPYLL